MKSILTILKMVQSTFITNPDRTGICAEINFLYWRNRITITEKDNFTAWMKKKAKEQSVFYNIADIPTRDSSQYMWPTQDQKLRTEFLEKEIKRLS